MKTSLMFGALLAFGFSTGSVHGQAVSASGGIGYSPGPQYDKMSWEVFVAAIAPPPSPSTAGTTFETWATDGETFPPVGTTPVWPVGSTHSFRFQASALARSHAPTALTVRQLAAPAPAAALPSGAPGCFALGVTEAGNFPVPGPAQGASGTSNCFAEEVRHNRPAFDYIKNNNLFSAAGLVARYEQWVVSNYTNGITFPETAIELKADWVPVPTLIQWLNNNNVTSVTAANVTQFYYTTTDTVPGGQTYALLSIHIGSKLLPNWIWATLEQQYNPGRCDTMGCYDQYGVAAPSSTAVAPASAPNTQYGVCTKSPALVKLFNDNKIGKVWDNYCLKDTQIDFVSAQNQPTLNGNSFTERLAAGVPISSSSCISCHATASFDSNGNGGPVNNVIGNQTVPSGLMPYDFVWSLLARH